ncbi:MAG TPA: MmgE/PrpD family protein [Candidatus Saccharimonadales bacterium]|jgi:2-methylcitrate dehydratase PrpD|nr:MmgE/PrpD family protein [Candidatus Saccharimonadales bacterium]
MSTRKKNTMPSAKAGANLSRRTLLQRAGWTAAVLAVPSGMFAADAGISPVMAKLSAYMAEAGGRALPDEVVEKAKHHILDTFAAMISGSDLPPARAAFNYARDFNTDKTSTIVASKMTSSPPEAAFINGMLAHSDETDDSNEFSQSHPGCAVVPATLAAGEKFGIDGTRFLRAVTLGYDIGPRMTISFNALDFRNHSHKSTHAISSVFGAASAAGCAADLNAQQMRWLLDYTSQQSSGIGAWNRDTEHIEKAFVFAGMSARNGVTSALVVHAGFDGLDDIFSGVDNYFDAYAPTANKEELVSQLGERYEIARTNIKKWTVGSPIQAPLDCMYNILKEHPAINANDVKSIVVREANTEARVVDNREMPDICLQHMIAVMMLDKTASFKAAHDKPRMKDPAVLAVRAKVQLVPDAELEKMEPARQAIVEITMNDGTKFINHVADVRGTVDNPMTREEVVQKCRDLVEPVLGKASCTMLIDKIMGLEKVKDIRELRSVLQKS